MSELYSITGMFYEDFPGISPWGGYLIRGTEDGEDEIEGMLADIYGISRITGTMNSESLEFLKEYKQNNQESFDYKFHLENGIWLGEYNSMQSDYQGRSLCKTNLCLNDLNFRKIDMRTTEGFAKALIDRMVENGKLESFEDPKSKEEMIKLP